MSKIGSSGSHSSGPFSQDGDLQGQSGTRGRDLFEGRRDGSSLRKGGREPGLRDGSGARSHLPGSATPEARSASFEQRFRDALQDGGERDTDRQPEQRRHRVLAEAIAPEPPALGWMAAPVPVQAPDSSAAPGSPGPVTGAVEERVAKLSAWVEQALRSELSAGTGQPLTIRIPLQDAADGMQNLTVSVTAASIEVTLERNAGEASAELVRAAQLLADRLQRRFAKGSVRVVEVVGEPHREASAEPTATGMAGFSAIFGPRDR